MDDAVDQRQREQREREPHEHLLRDEHGVGRRHERDGGGDERAEHRADEERREPRAAERRNALGESGMMQIALDADVGGVEAGLENLVGIELGLGGMHVGLLAVGGDGVGHDMRDALFRRPGRDRELFVVAHAPIMVAQYAAGMIDEPQRLFDVALPVTRLRVIFPDQTAQRGPDFLVRGSRGNA